MSGTREANAAKAAPLIAKAVKRRRRAVRWGEWTARTHIATILLGALACQAAIGAMSGKFGHSQYYHGTWIVFTLLAWVAIDFLVERRGPIQWGGIAITGLLATALLATVVTIAVRLHRSHGTRGVYGPTISNQQRVARTIARFSPSSRIVLHVSLYPDTRTRWPFCGN